MFGRLIWNARCRPRRTAPPAPTTLRQCLCCHQVGGGVMVVASALLLTALARTTDFRSLVLSTELAVGKAIDITTRYGYFITSMHVVPYDDAKTWVLREPTFNVFRDLKRLRAGPKRQTKQLSVEDLHMEFCDNMTQLLQVYFQDFSIEGLEQPWRAITAGWDERLTAEKVGLTPFYLTGNHCYVMVRVSRYRESETLRNLSKEQNIPVEEAVYEAIQNTTVGDSNSIAEFIKKYGSHYISSYTTGNSLYQVFVFDCGVYSNIKNQVQAQGVASFPQANIRALFSPSLPHTYVGDIKVASGNKTVRTWAINHLKVRDQFRSWRSLIKLHHEPSLLSYLDTLLGNEALLQLELKTLAPAFKDVKKKRWFEEILDNNLKLWETNMLLNWV